MPVLTPSANAQDCPVGQVLDATGSCVPQLVDEDVNSDTGQGGEEAPDPGNQEDVTPTPEGGEELPPAADPPEADPAEEDDPANLLPVTPEPVGDGYVTVHKYDCGADPDMAIKTLEELRGSCAPAAGVVFGATNLDAGDVVLTSEEFGRMRAALPPSLFQTRTRSSSMKSSLAATETRLRFAATRQTTRTARSTSISRPGGRSTSRWQPASSFIATGSMLCRSIRPLKPSSAPSLSPSTTATSHPE